MATDFSMANLTDLLFILKDGTGGLFFDVLLIPIFLVSIITSKDLDNYNGFIVSCFIVTILASLLFFLGLVSWISISIWVGLLVFSLLAKFLIR